MASQKKIDANRANARKSTGPRTAAGKAASRANAYRHGMRARTVIMPHEDQDQYHKLYNSYCKEFPCTTPHEQFLVKLRLTTLQTSCESHVVILTQRYIKYRQ